MDEAPSEPLRRRRWVLVVVWVLTSVAALWATFRLLGWELGYPAVPAMAYTPYVAAASIVPLALGLLSRTWIAAGVTALTLLCFAVAVLPRAFGGPQPGNGGVDVRVMSINTYYGAADAEQIIDLARENDVDVLSVQELSADALTALERAGVDDVLPHRNVELRPGAGGSGIFARHELTDVPGRDPAGSFAMPVARLSVPGAMPVEVVAVHPVPPSRPHAIGEWSDSLDDLPPADPHRIRILAGDFNATLDHAALREVVGRGYVDAADAVGQGLEGTWPANDTSFLPPVTIDHILVDERARVRSYDVLDVAGTDHRALVSILEIPPGPS